MDIHQVVYYNKSPEPRVQIITIVDQDIYSYKRIFLHFIWISALADIIVGLISAIGVILILLQTQNEFVISKSTAVILAGKLITTSSILAILFAVIQIVAKIKIGKLFYLCFIGFIGIIPLLAFSLKTINDTHQTIQKHKSFDFLGETLYDPNYEENWKRIYKNYGCCVIKEETLKFKNNSTAKEYFKKRIKRSNDSPSLLDGESVTIESSSYNICHSPKDISLRHCGFYIVNVLKNQVALIKLYGHLLLPMIFISIILCMLNILVSLNCFI